MNYTHHQEEFEGRRNYFWHRRDMEHLCMYKTNFLLTAQPTKAKTAVESQHHFLCLLFITDFVCSQYFALFNRNLKLQICFSLLLILLVYNTTKLPNDDNKWLNNEKHAELILYNGANNTMLLPLSLNCSWNWTNVITVSDNFHDLDECLENAAMKKCRMLKTEKYWHFSQKLYRICWHSFQRARQPTHKHKT